ncbi:hypothetical protein STRIP9103_04243 [Streptomyces ipomoeae 91-03]|uniref:Uncharacterized protein n=1 Tax=Streptomyces ipomoeae 91-03 TaxID=698759 RepID=L1L9C6_9ACTN|nr:hypothetical protein STRIP9103_04243 [Streptomyces ipomoeae 91-03]
MAWGTQGLLGPRGSTGTAERRWPTGFRPADGAPRTGGGQERRV